MANTPNVPLLVLLVYSFVLGGTSMRATPVISGFAPASGQPGDTFVVTGKNLDQTKLLFLGGYGCVFQLDTNLELFVTVPEAAASGPIVIYAADSVSRCRSWVFSRIGGLGAGWGQGNDAAPRYQPERLDHLSVHIRIIDNSTNGHINVDDFDFSSTDPDHIAYPRPRTDRIKYASRGMRARTTPSWLRANALKRKRITRQNLPCTFELDV